MENYRLVFNYYSERRGAGAANVEPHGAHRLPGVALHVDEAGFRALDAKEGYPERYGRLRANVQLRSGNVVEAWTYVAEELRDARGRFGPAHRDGQSVRGCNHGMGAVVNRGLQHGGRRFPRPLLFGHRDV